MFERRQKEGLRRGQFVNALASKNSFFRLLSLHHFGLCLIVYVSLQEGTGAVSKREVNSEKAGDAESNREDYVHIRAKRGQATNNHSLAERVINPSD